MYYSSYLLLLFANYNNAFVNYNKPFSKTFVTKDSNVMTIVHSGQYDQGNNTIIENVSETEPDIIENIRIGLDGFQKNKNGKVFDLHFYSIAAGYMLAESFQSLNDFLTHKPIEDFSISKHQLKSTLFILICICICK